MSKLITLGTSVLFIALLFTGYLYITGDLQNSYNFDASSNYSSLVNAFNSTNAVNNAEGQRSNLSTSVSDPFNLEALPFGIGAGFTYIDIASQKIGSASRIFSTSGDLFTTMLESSTEVLGIPEWITAVFVTALGVSILIFIASWIIGRDN